MMMLEVAKINETLFYPFRKVECCGTLRPLAEKKDASQPPSNRGAFRFPLTNDFLFPRAIVGGAFRALGVQRYA